MRQLLASGQLASSKAALYTVPNGMYAEIDSIVYYNTSAGALTCSTYVNGGTSRQLHSKSVAAAERQVVVDKNAPVYLTSGQSVEGLAGSATSVNYFVFGHLEQKG